MSERPVVLIVSADRSRVVRWAGWIERAGFRAESCTRDRPNGCPVTSGVRCSLRESASAAVIDAIPSGQPQAAACAKVPDDGRTVLVHRHGLDAPARSGIRLEHPLTESALVAAVQRALGGP